MGSDSTVFYGYKDLRIVNNFDHPIRFSFDIETETMICRLQSPEILPEYEIVFEEVHNDALTTKILTKRVREGQEEEPVCYSSYAKQ